jgi:hypothetical protein
MADGGKAVGRCKKFYQFKEIGYDAGASEYLSTNENKLFDGSAIQLMQTIYQCEKLPVKLRCRRLATRPQQALNIVTIVAADLPAFVGAVAVARKRLETLVRPCMQDHGRELMLWLAKRQRQRFGRLCRRLSFRSITSSCTGLLA